MKNLSTQNLIINEAQTSDRTFFFDLMNSPGWLQYIGDRGIRSLVDAEQYIRDSLLVSYKINGFGLYKVSLKPNLQPIGICGFLQRDYLEYPDLGFAILPQYAGRGLMKEAATALLQQAQEKQDWPKVFAITSPENERSQGLLQKLQFQKKGLIRPESQAILLFEKTLHRLFLP